VTNTQFAAWSGDFGNNYTLRNQATAEELNQRYILRYGHSRSTLNARFLAGIPLSARVLEIGTNVGNQLELLLTTGYANLAGIDVQPEALRLAAERVQASFLPGVATSIPFPDSSFDLVFTSGVLIHIAPEDLPRVMDEMYRCSRRYIWGFEYYSPEHKAINYRGMDNLLWKGDFSKMFLARFPDLVLVKEEHFPYLENPDNIDAMYLLCKGAP